MRTLLCKEVTAAGFIFFTNYESDKARQIEQNPQVGLCFHWQPMHPPDPRGGDRPAPARGRVRQYFAARPREAQLGAWSSQQSQVIADREHLRKRLSEVGRTYPDQVPRPENWGGYLVRPEVVEFWQGQPSRLHDRLRFVAHRRQPR